MGFLRQHPETKVTQIINVLCKKSDASKNDSFLESKTGYLLDAIKNQNDFSEPGPVEAARAIRKKLKYGSQKDQFHALRILDILVVNGGPKLQLLYEDNKLLDRLQVILIGDATDNIHPKIRNYAFEIMNNWQQQFSNAPELDKLLLLYGRCEKYRLKSKSRNSQVPDFMNDEADMDFGFENDDDEAEYSRGSGGSSDRPRTNDELDRKFKIPKINYEKETPKILNFIAKANIASTNLINILNGLGKDELSIHSPKANEAFDQCRSTRRIILRYLQLVNKEELLGPLLKCNDELVAGLKKYEEKSSFENEYSDPDVDSLQDLDSDNGASVESSIIEDSDDDDYYTRRSERSAPSVSDTSVSTDFELKRRPPPVPPKKSILVEPSIQQVNSYDSLPVRYPPARVPSRQSRPSHQSMQPMSTPRNRADDFNPFSDDNEVTPISWS
ncbi:Lsb5 protein [Martiniozyma asiatica (nom. inval.)]|nr:Lsb5 protein [Martiniozyma asiatica]